MCVYVCACMHACSSVCMRIYIFIMINLGRIDLHIEENYFKKMRSQHLHSSTVSNMMTVIYLYNPK